MSNLFENLQLMKESQREDSLKSNVDENELEEGLFDGGKKKREQCDKLIKDILEDNTNSVANEAAYAAMDMLKELTRSKKDNNSNELDEFQIKEKVLAIAKGLGAKLKDNAYHGLRSVLNFVDSLYVSDSNHCKIELQKTIDGLEKLWKSKDKQADKAMKYLSQKIADNFGRLWNDEKKFLYGESVNLKDENETNNVVESAQLRQFTGKDYWGWGGAEKFADGSEPLIAEGEGAVMIISGPDMPGDDEYATIGLYYGEDDDKWAWKSYDTKEIAIKDAKILLNLIDEEIDETQLKRFGFEIM